MSKKFIGVTVGLFILVLGAFFFTLRWGSQLPFGEDIPSTPGTPAAAVPKVTGVTLTVTTSKKGNTLVVRWENLPNGTIALDIFRSTKGKNNWSLWKTIAISPGDIAGGTMGIDIGNATLGTYSFYIQAVTGGGGGSGTNPGTPDNGNVLWASPITDAPISTSTPNNIPPPPGPGSQNGNGSTGTQQIPPPASGQPPATPSSTPQNPTPSSTNPSVPGNTNPPAAPSGTPYYTPQIQISGYGGAQSGHFWVQHIDQTIQIGWQNLPAGTKSVTVFRSERMDGQWTTVLAQKNPDITGPYTIQIVDDTLGNAYYYDMNASAGSTTLATYGPVFLPAIAQ